MKTWHDLSGCGVKSAFCYTLARWEECGLTELCQQTYLYCELELEVTVLYISGALVKNPEMCSGFTGAEQHVREVGICVR